jgi:ubiquinone biosynthesis monooxygenase Coq7
MNTTRHYSLFDKLIIESDRALRTLSKNAHLSATPSPAGNDDESILSTSERKHASGLMRVNHTGEVCAQALYQGQALTAKLPNVREEMEQAAKEEIDHLHWCDERLKELNSRPSMLNPLFYGVSFSMGALAGAVSDEVSLGFVAATEELVCKHLEKHLDELPENDPRSRSVVKQMLKDEARHKQAALDAGGSEFPFPVKMGMKLISEIMTKTTYRI